MRTYTFALEDLLKILLRAEGITEGNWSLGFQVEVGTGPVRKDETSLPAPSVIVRIVGASVTEKEQAESGTLDATTLTAG